MKKIPMRRCVATGEQCPKKELVRIVRTPEGEVKIDLTGKCNGRGAYLKLSEEAIDIAKKKKVLARALSVDIPNELYDELLAMVAHA